MAAFRGSGSSKNPVLGPYFTVPKGLIQNGIAARIGPSAVTVYVALCEQANRKNGNSLSVSDKTLAADTGVAERTIRNIRTRLSEAGLVLFEREPGSSYSYTLVAVQLARRVPVKERLRQPKKPRGVLHNTIPNRPGTSPEVQQNLHHPSGKFCYTSSALFADPTGKIC